jgi:hypothetical protein
VAEHEIRILWNTIPIVYGKREEAEKAVREAIGQRAGVWTVTLGEPQNASWWEIGIDSADGKEWHFTFDGPDEQTTPFITSVINEALP